MSKYRVFELAKEFGADSKKVLDILKRNNYKVNNNFSSVDDDGYKVVKQAFTGTAEAGEAPAEGTGEAKS